MGYLCRMCKAETGCETVKDLLQHFHCRHGIAKYDKITLCCYQDDCMRTFSNLKSLAQHVRRSHPVCSGSGSLPFDNLDRSEMDNSEPQHSADISMGKSIAQTDLKDDIATLVLRAQMKLGQSNLVADGIRDVLTTVTDDFSQKLNNVLESIESPNCDPKPLISSILESLASLPSAVQDVSTAYLRNKHLSTKMGLVQPTEYHLGTRYENHYSKSSGQLQQVPVADTFAYVSVLETRRLVLVYFGP
jgi:hypothetical protein